jgi:hypothetical protein
MACPPLDLETFSPELTAPALSEENYPAQEEKSCFLTYLIF